MFKFFTPFIFFFVLVGPLAAQVIDEVPAAGVPAPVMEADLENTEALEETGTPEDGSKGGGPANVSPQKPGLGQKARELVQISGGINATSTLYTVRGIESRRPPFFYLINGSLNINVAGIDIPVTASVSTQSKEFAVPFNQFGLSPKYKAVTLHLGYRSLRYSNFTLSGSTFLGAGIDVAPKNLPVKVSAMYGRFEKASIEGSNMGMNNGRPTYERRGFATNILLGNKKKNINLTLLKARDDVNSILLPDSLPVRPEENLVLSVGTKSQLFTNLQLEMEYAFSSFTQDTRNQDLILERFTYINNIGGLFIPNATTEFNKAFLGNLSYNFKTANLKLAYRRIDPNYRTMGAVFLNNDLEDITLNLAATFLDNQLQLAIGGGVQRNNLDEVKISATKRVIGSANLAYAPNEKLSLQLDFSNYNTQTETSRFYDLDSLDFYQLTRSSGLSIQYAYGSSLLPQALFLQVNQQNVINSMDNSSVNQSVNLGHQLLFKAYQTTLAATANYNRYSSTDLSFPSYGPGLVVSKTSLKKKLKTIFSATHLTSAQNKERQTQNITFRLNNSYRLLKNHAIGLNISLIDRSSYTPNGKSFTEHRTVLNYGYTF